MAHDEPTKTESQYSQNGVIDEVANTFAQLLLVAIEEGNRNGYDHSKR